MGRRGERWSALGVPGTHEAKAALRNTRVVRVHRCTIEVASSGRVWHPQSLSEEGVTDHMVGPGGSLGTPAPTPTAGGWTRGGRGKSHPIDLIPSGSLLRGLLCIKAIRFPQILRNNVSGGLLRCKLRSLESPELQGTECGMSQAQELPAQLTPGPRGTGGAPLPPVAA